MKILMPTLCLLFALGTQAFAQNSTEDVQVVRDISKPITAPVSDYQSLPSVKNDLDKTISQDKEAPKCPSCCGLVCKPSPVAVRKSVPVITRYKYVEKKSAPIIIQRQNDNQPIIINNINTNTNTNNNLNATPQPKLLRPQTRVVRESEDRFVQTRVRKYYRRQDAYNSSLYLFGGFTQIKNFGGEYEFRGSHLGLGLYFEHDTMETRNMDYSLVKGSQGGLVLHYHFKNRDEAFYRKLVEFGMFAKLGVGKFTYDGLDTFTGFTGEVGVDVEIPVIRSFSIFAKVGTTYLKTPDVFYHTGENVAAGVRLDF
jgi:hypothetical protein